MSILVLYNKLYRKYNYFKMYFTFPYFFVIWKDTKLFLLYSGRQFIWYENIYSSKLSLSRSHPFSYPFFKSVILCTLPQIASIDHYLYVLFLFHTNGDIPYRLLCTLLSSHNMCLGNYSL